MFEGQRGVARHGVKAPVEFAAARAVGAYVSAHAELGAAVADDNASLNDAWRAGDGVGARAVDGVDLPVHLAGHRVERDQAAVVGAQVYTTLPYRHAAVDDVAAAAPAPLPWHLGIVDPQLAPGRCVECVHDAPRAGGIHHAVYNDGAGLQPVRGHGVIGPGQAQALYVVAVDLRQRRVALLRVAASVRQPVVGFGVGRGYALRVHRAGHGGNVASRRSLGVGQGAAAPVCRCRTRRL